MSALDTPIERRTVLKGFLIAGPTLAVAARLGFADDANAFPTKTDELPDIQDFTDIFVATQQPTVYDLKIEIKPDNRVYLEGPRAEVGQGFMTMIGMLVADGLDVPFASMDIITSPAEPVENWARSVARSWMCSPWVACWISTSSDWSRK